MWYAASLLFKGSHSPGSKQSPLWEESIRLIDASSEAEALVCANTIGRAEEHAYESAGGDVVTWSFEEVERIGLIQDPLEHGTELLSRYLKDAEVISLLGAIDS